MSSRTMRFALSAARFPFISTQQPRAVVSPDLDSAGHVPRSFYGSEDSMDVNTIQPLYMENVIPVVHGLRSVRYEQAKLAPSVEVPTGGFPALGWDSQFSLRLSDPAGTAATAASGDTLLTEEETVTVLINKQGSLYTFAMRWPDSHSADAPVGWQPFPAMVNGGSLHSTFTLNNLVIGVTHAYVAGAQFVCVPGEGVYYAGYTVSTANARKLTMLPCVGGVDDARVPVANQSNNALLANLPFKAADISLISQANGYLLIASGNQIAWAIFDGAVFDYSEFKNNETTGSGVRIPEDLEGNITAVTPVPGGFLIFSSRNCVAAFYSSANTVNPWIFRKVANCGGVLNSKYVTTEDESGGVYAYTSAGLQRVTLNGAQDLEPAANDFLMGYRQEEYDDTTGRLTSYGLSDSYHAKLALVGARYLIISYSPAGFGTFNYALVFDTTLKRWGKLKHPHAEIFSYIPKGGSVFLTIGSLSSVTFRSLASRSIASLKTDPTQQIIRGRQMAAMLDASGQITSVIFDDRESTDTTTIGVLVVGAFQLSRSRQTALYRITVEGVDSNMRVRVLPASDGRNADRVVDFMNVEQSGDVAVFGGAEVATNHTILLTGQFSLSSVIAEAETEGGTI